MQEDGHATYVVGDVHGHLDELLASLADAGLIDAEASWSGADTHLWFLGDFVDRGPDGIGVIDLVMRLAAEAEEAGGHVQALLGNHEILLLGMHRYGNTEVPSDFGPRSFARSWEMNGGQHTDQEALTDEHIEWLSDRPALALVGEHLLMHSDTVEYLVWGTGIDEINAGIRQVLRSEDIVGWWEVWRRLTTRHAFRGPHGGEVAAQLLGVLGGDQVVHGHSVIADQLGVAPAQIETPYEYADGRALGVDGGVFVGGPCLVVQLPFSDKPDDELPEDIVELDPETGIYRDSDTDTDTDAEPDLGAEPEVEAEAEAEPEPEAAADAEAELEPEAAADAEPEVEPEPQSEPDAKAEDSPSAEESTDSTGEEDRQADT